MQLKFIGQDGSLGLRHGEIYKVDILSVGNRINAYIDSKFCPYDSLSAFMKNWEEI